MQFRISDTFTASLGRLTNDEQKAVKITVFDLQSDPKNPGIQLHRIDRCKDPNFWSARVGRDIRLILHKTDASLLLCYVDHHDNAYDWAVRRKIETHPRTGAAQLVEIRETVREITIPQYVEEPVATSAPAVVPVLDGVERDTLLEFGVPEEWIEDVLGATEDTLFDVAERLPGEAAEAVLELATGGTPVSAGVPETAPADPFAHPDAQRRFRVMSNVDELRQALEYPWDRWTVFLHPSQRDLVQRQFNGPVRVTGSAGTGKTVVAIHRTATLARQNPDWKVLLTTFSPALARALAIRLNRLCGVQAPELSRITVRAVNDIGLDLYEAEFGKPTVPTASMLRMTMREVMGEFPDLKFSLDFLMAEWSEVVDAWQLRDWDSYRDVPRLGRKTRLGEKQRKQLWHVFERVRAELQDRGLATMPMVFAAVTDSVAGNGALPFQSVVVDEAQDVSVPQLRLLAALGGGHPHGLFFAGDLGQRIFQTPFSWKSLGVDVRGRSHRLRVNYRTSHQIRAQADRLLPPELSDVDGLQDERSGTVSVFNGPDPVCRVLGSAEAESQALGEWIRDAVDSGMNPDEIGVFVRTESQLDRARKAVQLAGHRAAELDGYEDAPEGFVSIGTMHLAKGLEFRAVAVMACDDEAIPLQERIEEVVDESDLEEVYNTERHLLYVACTRARDRLHVSGVEPASEFLDDFRGVQ